MSATVKYLQLICSQLLQWWNHLEFGCLRGMLKNQLRLEVALFYDAVQLYLASWFRIICIAFFTQRFYGSLGHIKTSFTLCLPVQCEDRIQPFSFQHRILCLLNIVCCQSDAFWSISVACLKCKLLYLHLQEMKAWALLSSVLTLWSHKACSTFFSQWPINGILWETVFLRLFLGGSRHILTFWSHFFKPLKQIFSKSYKTVGAFLGVRTECLPL